MPISGNELLVLLVLAAVLIGPERLPYYAQQLGSFVRQARRLVAGAKSQLKAELGPDFEDVDWSQFDPRRYDPRRIVQDALLEDGAPSSGQAGAPGRQVTPARPAEPPSSAPAPRAPALGAGALGVVAGASAAAAVGPGEPAATPFDDEAT